MPIDFSIEGLKLWGLTPSKIATKYLHKGNVNILANSIPKSGTHLLERLLYLLPPFSRKIKGTLFKSNIGSVDFNSLCKHLVNGQFLVSHFAYDKDYLEVIHKNNLKTIFMIRDPRDIVISDAHYITNINKKHKLHDYFINLPSNKERLYKCMLGNKNPELFSIAQTLERFYLWIKEKNVLTVKFEDLIGAEGGGSKEIQDKTVSRILDFVEVDTNYDERSKLLEKIFYSKSKTFHKGKIRQWEKIFDDDDKSLFKNIAGEWLIKYGYENDYNW